MICRLLVQLFALK